MIEADPENLTAIRSLDRLYAQTERWAELAERPRARGRDRASRPTRSSSSSYRLGQVQQTRLGNLDAAIAAYRDVINAAPEHQATLEALEGLFASGVKQVEVGEILEPLYRSMSEWEKLSHVYEAQLAHTQGQEDRLAAYYRLAELLEDKLLDPAKTLVVYIRALEEYPLDEKAGEEAPRLAGGVDGGWETLANAYADVLGAHTDKAVQQRHRAPPRAAPSRTSWATSARPRRRTSTSSASSRRTSRRSRTSIASTCRSSRGPDLAQILEMRVKATADTLDLVDLYARLGELYETKLGDLPNAIRAYRRIFDELDKTHEGAIAALARIYEQQEAWQELDAVYQRELENASGDTAEAEIRAKIAHLAADKLEQPERAIETWKAVLDLRGEDPEALHALANLYESLGAVGQAGRHPRARVRHRVDRRGARQHPHATRAHDERASWGATTPRSRTGTASSTSTTPTSGRCAPSRTSAAAQETRTSSWPSLHQLVDRPRPSLEAEELKEIFRELGKTYGGQLQQPYDAADAWRKLLEVGPDFEAMDALEAIYRSEEKWTDVIDVKMQRAEALAEPAERIEELRSVAALWREQVGDADGARAAYEKILEIDGDARRGVRRAREAPPGGRPLGAARRAATSRGSRPARRRARRRSCSARSRASSRRSSTTRTRRSTPSSTRSRWTSTTARRRGTSSGWRRPPAAGPRSSRPSTAG